MATFGASFDPGGMEQAPKRPKRGAASAAALPEDVTAAPEAAAARNGVQGQEAAQDLTPRKRAVVSISKDNKKCKEDFKGVRKEEKPTAERLKEEILRRSSTAKCANWSIDDCYKWLSAHEAVPLPQTAAEAMQGAAAGAAAAAAETLEALSASAPLDVIPDVIPGSAAAVPQAAAVAQALAAEKQAEAAAAAAVCGVAERWRSNRHGVRLLLICAHTKEDFLQRDKPMPLRNQKDACGRHWYWEKHLQLFNDKAFMPQVPVSSDEDVNEMYKKAKLDPNWVLDPARGECKADRLLLEFTKLRKTLSVCLVNHRASGQGYKPAAAVEEDHVTTMPDLRADALAGVDTVQMAEGVEMTEQEKVTKSHTVYSADFKHFAGSCISCGTDSPHLILLSYLRVCVSPSHMSAHSVHLSP